jgi:hypothetical protein
MEQSRMTVRRALATISLAAVLLASFDYQLLRVLQIDRATLLAAYERFADHGWYPDYPNFMRGVYAHTNRGDRIALIVPPSTWSGGYAYAFYRGSYFLAGREVLPVVMPGDVIHRENFRDARYVAFWHVAIPRNARVVWSGYGGALVTKR